MADEYQEEKENSSELSDEKIVEEAKEFFKSSSSYWSDIYRKANEDDLFASGLQWDPVLLQERKEESRPALVINKIPQFIRQVSNEMRKNRPSIKVYPVGDGAKIETAKVRQGMIRNIEYESDAQNAYNTAGESAVRKSIGFFRIGTDYENSKSFNQVIKIIPIHNPLSVRFDPASIEPDGKDATKASIFDDITKAEFKALYPDVDYTSPEYGDNEFPTDLETYWYDKETVRVLEYYVKRFETITIWEVKDLEGNVQVVEESELAEGMTKVRSRIALKSSIKHYKIAGCKVIEKTDVIGSYIPVIPMYGARNFVNGKWELESLHRHAQDSQRMVNYYSSSEAETIALAPRAPYIAEKTQIPPEYLHMWQTANSKAWPFLPYDKVEGVAPPQRNSYEPATAAVVNSKLHASDDIKATTGIYDDSLGRNSQNKSGIALQRTQQQSQTSNFHFMDNQSISIKHGGRIINEWLDKIYDTARQIRIIGEDGSQELTTINQPFEEGGQMVHHDLSQGQYDVVLDVGPNYETKRQESADMLLEFAKSFPSAAQVIPDLVAKNMDFPDAQLLADRLRKTLPAGIADDKNKQPLPPQVQQQLQQMGQLIEQLTQTANKQGEIIKNKTNELESKERIEFAKLQNTLAIESMKVSSVEAMAIFQADLNTIKSQLGVLEIGQPIDEESNDLGNKAADQQGQMNE